MVEDTDQSEHEESAQELRERSKGPAVEQSNAALEHKGSSGELQSTKTLQVKQDSCKNFAKVLKFILRLVSPEHGLQVVIRPVAVVIELIAHFNTVGLACSSDGQQSLQGLVHVGVEGGSAPRVQTLQTEDVGCVQPLEDGGMQHDQSMVCRRTHTHTRAGNFLWRTN